MGMTVICGDDEHEGSSCWRKNGEQVPQTITRVIPRGGVEFVSDDGREDYCFCFDQHHLYRAEKALETLEVGDFVKNSYGEFGQVLAVLHRNSELTAYVLSGYDKDIAHDNLKGAGSVYTAFELASRNFTIHNPTPVAPVAKRMTVDEVSALVGETVVIVE